MKAPADWTAEFPAAPRAFDLDGLRYSYVDEGLGPILLCVHGNPTWSFAWRHIIADFSRDHRVIAIDHIGCGRSDKPRDYPYRLEQHVSNLARFVEGLDLRQVTLVGHDWGGCIGMGAAGRSPERFSRFVLMNTAAFRSTFMPLRIAVCRIPGLGAIGVRGLNLFSRAALRMAVEHRSRMTAAARAGYLAPYDSWDHRIAVHEFVRDIPLRPGDRSYAALEEIEHNLGQFATSPMLLPWGARDWCFTTDFLAEWRRRFPAARAAVFADAGHYVFEDADERLRTAMREFLLASPLA